MANVTKTPSTSYATFEAFHEANPNVYQEFKKLALRLIAKGYTRISSKMLIEYIRCSRLLITKSDDRFKINNNYTALYSRKFVREYPQYKKLFKHRTLRNHANRIDHKSPFRSQPSIEKTTA